MLPLDAMPFRLFKHLFSSFIRPLVKNENWNVLPPARSHEIDYFLRAPECGDHRIEQGSSSLFIAETCCHFLLRSSFSLSEAKNWTGWLLCSFLSLGSIPLCKRGEEEATEYLSKVTWPVRSPIDRKNANLLDQEKPFFFSWKMVICVAAGLLVQCILPDSISIGKQKSHLVLFHI